MTARAVKKFCYEALSIFVNSEDDIEVEKIGNVFKVNIHKATGVPNHLIGETWARRVSGTKFDRLKIRLNYS
jgi:hypothetical protein